MNHIELIGAAQDKLAADAALKQRLEEEREERLSAAFRPLRDLVNSCLDLPMNGKLFHGKLRAHLTGRLRIYEEQGELPTDLHRIVFKNYADLDGAHIAVRENAGGFYFEAQFVENDKYTPTQFHSIDDALGGLAKYLAYVLAPIKKEGES